MLALGYVIVTAMTTLRTSRSADEHRRFGGGSSI